MRRLNGPIDVDFINRTFFPNDLKRVGYINEGRCFLWAYIAYRLYRDAELYDIEAHAFVRSKSNKRFYDAEKPNGEVDWKDLRVTNFGRGCGCAECLKGTNTYKIAGPFRRRWFRMADRYAVNWNSVNEKIVQVLATCEPATETSLSV